MRSVTLLKNDANQHVNVFVFQEKQLLTYPKCLHLSASLNCVAVVFYVVVCALMVCWHQFLRVSQADMLLVSPP